MLSEEKSAFYVPADMEHNAIRFIHEQTGEKGLRNVFIRTEFIIGFRNVLKNLNVH